MKVSSQDVAVSHLKTAYAQVTFVGGLATRRDSTNKASTSLVCA